MEDITYRYEQIIDKIKSVIIQTEELDLNIDQIDNKWSLINSPLGIDSSSTLIILEELENCYDIEFDDEELQILLLSSIEVLARGIIKKMDFK